MSRAALAVSSARFYLSCRARHFDVGVVTCEGRQPVLVSGGEVRIARLAVRGHLAPVELGAAPGGVLQVGSRVFVNQGASVVAHLGIEIGDDVRIGDFAGIYDTDHHGVEEGATVRSARVHIGRNVWIASRALVLPGVTVGEHAVVAAGAVVTRDVPPRTLVAGNPAAPIRQLHASDQWRRG